MVSNTVTEVFETVSSDGVVKYEQLKTYLQKIIKDASESEVCSICDEVFSDKSVVLNLEKFKLLWNNFIQVLLQPTSAFLIVDVQNDFISGSLALSGCPAKEDGAEVVPVINQLLDTVKFNHVVYTYDWHPSDHISFHSNLKQHFRGLLRPEPKAWESVSMFDRVQFDGKPPLEQTLWPDHCIQGSEGSKLHQDLKVIDGAIEIYKGGNPNIDSYSAFWDNGEVSSTGLLDKLKSRNVTDVYVCGLATDICVNFTATHACKHNFRVVLVEDACRGVEKGAIEETKKKLLDLGALIRSSETISPLVNGEEVPVTLAKIAAVNFRRKFGADLMSA